MSAERKLHVVTFPFPITRVNGGLGSVLNSIDTRRSQSVIVLTPDTQPTNIGDQIRIEPISPEKQANPHLYDLWFSDWFSQLFPDAYSKVGNSQDTLSRMYAGEEYSTQLGSRERIAEHNSLYGFSQESQIEELFAERFRDFFEHIPEKAIIHWQDYFFAPVMNKFSDLLRSKDCRQIFYLHVSVSQHLAESPKGQELLLAISKMDEVFVHTDIFVERLRAQLKRLGLNVPTIKRFDLGPDRTRLEDDLEQINDTTYRGLPEYKSLADNQRILLDEVVATKDIIPNRFITTDRVNPTKGSENLLLGIEEYLDNLNLPLEELRRLYRFFLVSPQSERNTEEMERHHLTRGYIEKFKETLERLKRKYPGIIFSCDGLPSTFIPMVIDDANFLNASVEEGLNLAVMESIFINGLTRRNRTAMLGDGAGLAYQLDKDGKKLLLIVARGDIHAVAQGIDEIVRESASGNFLSNNRLFNERILSKRNPLILAE